MGIEDTTKNLEDPENTSKEDPKKTKEEEEEDDINEESVNENEEKKKAQGSSNSKNSIKIAVPNYSLPSNKISTTKYTLLSFIPLNLFKQFKQVTYLYYLIVIIFQTIPFLSISNGVPTSIITLCFVVVAAFFKDVAEDLTRWSLDRIENEFETQLIAGNKVIKVKWHELLPGQIIQVKEGQTVPADCILLFSSNVVKENCHVDTFEIDGQTNLVLKTRVNNPEDIQEENPFDYLNSYVNSKINFDEPNANISTFQGQLELVRGSIPLAFNNLLLRNSVLRNTDFIFAVVIYTGNNTKTLQMQLKPRQKRTSLEKRINKMMKSQFILSFVLSLLAAIYHILYIYIFQSSMSNFINFFSFNYFVQFCLKFINWILLLL